MEIDRVYVSRDRQNICTQDKGTKNIPAKIDRHIFTQDRDRQTICTEGTDK